MPRPSPSIRPATGADHDLFVRLFPELGVDDPVLDRAQFERDVLPTMLLAEDEQGEPKGYVYFNIVKDVAYVRHLVTAPHVRRGGVGRALLEAAAARARGAGCSSWCLNVKPGNVPAVALYEKAGFTPRYTSRVLILDWAYVDQDLPAGDVRARRIEAADDTTVEHALHLLDGQLAAARENPGRVLQMLERSDGTPLGAAIFNPDFPGAYPFRVASPELAPLLLHALFPFRREEHTSINVVTENQPDVADLLEHLGGRPKLDIVHMAGSLTCA